MSNAPVFTTIDDLHMLRWDRKDQVFAASTAKSGKPVFIITPTELEKVLPHGQQMYRALVAQKLKPARVLEKMKDFQWEVLARPGERFIFHSVDYVTLWSAWRDVYPGDSPSASPALVDANGNLWDDMPFPVWEANLPGFTEQYQTLQTLGCSYTELASLLKAYFSNTPTTASSNTLPADLASS